MPDEVATALAAASIITTTTTISTTIIAGIRGQSQKVDTPTIIGTEDGGPGQRMTTTTTMGMRRTERMI